AGVPEPVSSRRSFLASIPLVAAAAAASRPGKPNIIFILADDIGYGDLGCYGAERVKTPNVDRIAREGIRFTDAHSSASVCTPTRYAAITGQYAWRNPAADHILSGEDPPCQKIRQDPLGRRCSSFPLTTPGWWGNGS